MMGRITMRSILVVATLLLAGAFASSAYAQEGISGDAAATYQWVHTNAGPGQCGCFGLNGGGVSASWEVHGPWAVVADFSSQTATNVPAAPPEMPSTTLSVRFWRMRRDLPAPRTARIAISRRRAVPRARSKFATLAQASSSTAATAPSKTHEAVRTS